jgi:hypothetical protein
MACLGEREEVFIPPDLLPRDRALCSSLQSGQILDRELGGQLHPAGPDVFVGSALKRSLPGVEVAAAELPLNAQAITRGEGTPLRRACVIQRLAVRRAVGSGLLQRFSQGKAYQPRGNGSLRRVLCRCPGWRHARERQQTGPKNHEEAPDGEMRRA